VRRGENNAWQEGRHEFCTQTPDFYLIAGEYEFPRKPMPILQSYCLVIVADAPRAGAGVARQLS